MRYFPESWSSLRRPKAALGWRLRPLLWWRHRQAVLAAQCESRRVAARDESARVLDELATGRAEAVFRAYSAGIHAAVLANRKGSLDLSLEELIRLPGVVFVNILQPDGSVIASSDRKLIVLGKAGERGAWALGVQGFSMRAGDIAGTTEMAMPIQDAAGVKAVLWLAYDTERIKAQAQEHRQGDPASGL